MRGKVEATISQANPMPTWVYVAMPIIAIVGIIVQYKLTWGRVARAIEKR